MMRKIICIIVLIFLLADSNALLAAPISQKASAIRQDTGSIELRAFDQAALAKYKKQDDFQYGTNFQTARPLWNRFWKWFWNYFNEAVSDTTSNNIARSISIFLLAGLIIFLIVKFSGLSLNQLFTGKARKVVIPYYESTENIHEIHFDEEIEKAVQRLDYRLAVRMLYLKCLKKLSDSGLIAWQIDKTNSAYFAELDNPVRKEKFGLLTRRFEYIWYGEFNIDQSAFREIDNEFKDFNEN